MGKSERCCKCCPAYQRSIYRRADYFPNAVRPAVSSSLSTELCLKWVRLWCKNSTTALTNAEQFSSLVYGNKQFKKRSIFSSDGW